MEKPENLSQLVQRYGYAKKKKVKLYGKELELVSDPTNRQGDDVIIPGGIGSAVGLIINHGHETATRARSLEVLRGSPDVSSSAQREGPESR